MSVSTVLVILLLSVVISVTVSIYGISNTVTAVKAVTVSITVSVILLLSAVIFATVSIYTISNIVTVCCYSCYSQYLHYQ